MTEGTKGDSRRKRLLKSCDRDHKAATVAKPRQFTRYNNHHSPGKLRHKDSHI